MTSKRPSTVATATFMGRRTSATMVAVVIAAGVWAATGRFCPGGRAGPEDAAEAFVQATRAGDAEAAYELLGPRSQKSLAEAAVRATARAGGAARFEPHDMLEVAPSSRDSGPLDVTATDVSGDRATVVVGGQDTLQLVRVDGRWRVELPAP